MVDDSSPVAPEGADAAATTEPGQTQVTEPLGTGRTLMPGSATVSGVVALPPSGYALGAPIGRGGMGEVIGARDLRIGREVAVKRMSAQEPSPEATTRFLREARIQARLDHPAIVPVHELGVDEKGRLYFTMKRLAGKTLGARVADGLSLNEALDHFTSVCQAIDFAHSRGVVHRDLKPSNIMIGDYGEVYVIDWGIARVLDEDEKPAVRISATDITTLDDSTKSGALLGTPGYMSPEQLRGLAATGAADSYALGAILFELLCGAPLHPRGEPGIARTLSEPQVRPSERTPDRTIPPELDELCFTALAEDPSKRPTARQLADGVRKYLVGDRDLEKRRALALEHFAAARTAIEANDVETAVRQAGIARILDPELEDANAMLARLVLEPPRTLPAACAADLELYEAQLSRERSRQGLWTYSSLFILLPAVFLVDIKNWYLVFAFYGLLGLAMGTTAIYRRTGRPQPALVLALNFAIIILFSRIGGPFVLTPMFICGVLIALVSIPWINERTWVVVAWTAASVLGPIAADQLVPGWLTTTWHSGSMRIVSNIVESHGNPTAFVLITGSTLLTIALALFMLAVTRRRREAQRRLFVQAWHLQQVLPGLVKSPTDG